MNKDQLHYFHLQRDCYSFGQYISQPPIFRSDPYDSKGQLTQLKIKYHLTEFCRGKKRKRLIAIATILVKTLSYGVTSFVGVEVTFNFNCQLLCPPVVPPCGTSTCSVGSLTSKVDQLEQHLYQVNPLVSS